MVRTVPPSVGRPVLRTHDGGAPGPEPACGRRCARRVDGMGIRRPVVYTTGRWLPVPDARIRAKLVRKLSVPYVARGDALREALEKAVREASRGGAEIEAAFAGWVDAERVERTRELDAAARDVRVVLPAHGDRRVLREHRAGLVDARFAEIHLARQNECLRTRARGREAAHHEKLIGTHLHLAKLTVARPPDGSREQAR